ncbi:L-glyceraldehyde 3-phosphate reductase [Weissella viridescens]|uniref:L-glyceraldehyde 3-phosphate reductase n=1 Tax=Weissella viridescens TaxID=1629 RepID=A0A380P2P0_WEIVI|nr:L-glyceraldehyde 3-phosphate reductase [Weissella viridescens]
MVYAAADNRYDVLPYRRVSDSGLILPALSFGLWRNLGDQKPLANSREVMLKAFDNGIFLLIMLLIMVLQMELPKKRLVQCSKVI